MDTDRAQLESVVDSIARSLALFTSIEQDNYGLTPDQASIRVILMLKLLELQQYLYPDRQDHDYMVECSECGDQMSYSEGATCCRCVDEYIAAMNEGGK